MKRKKELGNKHQHITQYHETDNKHCRMTNYELLRWLVETPSRDIRHYRMLNVSAVDGSTFLNVETVDRFNIQKCWNVTWLQRWTGHVRYWSLTSPNITQMISDKGFLKTPYSLQFIIRANDSAINKHSYVHHKSAWVLSKLQKG